MHHLRQYYPDITIPAVTARNKFANVIVVGIKERVTLIAATNDYSLSVFERSLQGGTRRYQVFFHYTVSVTKDLT